MKTKNLHKIIRELLIIAATLPIIILGIYAYTSQANVYNQEVETSAKDSLMTMQAVIDEFDTTNKSMVKIFSGHPAITDLNQGKPDSDKIVSAIKAFETQFSQIERMTVILRDGIAYDEKGKILSANYDSRVLASYQRAAASPNRVILTTLNIDTTKINYFSITYSLAFTNSITNEIVGVILVDIKPEKLEMMLSGIHLRVDGTLVVADSEGEIVFGQYTPLRSLLEKSPDELKNMMTLLKPNEIKKFNNESYRVYIGRSLKTGWHILGIVPMEGLYALHKNTLFIVVLVTLLMLIAVWWLSSRVEKIVTRPIDQLVESISKFGLTENIESINLKGIAPGELIIIQDTLNKMIERIRGQGDELIQALSNAIEANDEYTKGHCERVTKLSLKIGEKINMTPEELNDLSLAAVLHDIGKVGVPSQILNKPGKLTEEEYDIMKGHPRIGAGIVSGISSLAKAAEIIHQHHERYDGTGYPSGLQGEKIHIMARILCISDSYDAMTTKRSYRTIPLDIEKARKELIEGKERQFDPVLVEAFLQIIDTENEWLNLVFSTGI